MPKLVQNYQCVFCEQDGFQTLPSAKAHERKCKAKIAAAEKKAADKLALKTSVALRVRECKIVEDVIELCNTVYKEQTGEDFDLKISSGFTKVASLSNSHGAPFGKKTNWSGREKDIQQYYLGFRGIVSYKPHAFSKAFDTLRYLGIGIHSGTGSPSHHDAYFFLDDFPGIQETVDEQNRLADEYFNKMKRQQEVFKEKIEQSDKIAVIDKSLENVLDQISALKLTRNNLRTERYKLIEKIKLDLPPVDKPNTNYVGLSSINVMEVIDNLGY